MQKIPVFLCAFFLLSCAKSSPSSVSQCGDGLIQGAEACDDGVLNGTACPYGLQNCQSCSAECTIVEGAPSYCGDGVVQENEECDAIEAQADCAYGETFCWVCDTSCRQVPGNTRFCGDGLTDAANGEACDTGGTQERCDYGTLSCSVCSPSCQLTEIDGTYCGDGLLQSEHEICDDGNTESGDYCRADCNQNTGFCGDSIVQNNEDCDDGNTQSGDYCRNDCLLVTGRCGDSILQANEICDDGNNDDSDYCSADCLNTTGSCGDGVIQSPEVCDDGNQIYGDYCAADCSTNTGTCGDGLRQSNEICDDGNNEEGDYCNPDCTTVTGACGDNEIQSNEICDDANTVDGDYCSADCQTITGACGDDIIQPNEACDDGNTDEGDYCQSDCMAITGTCGDGIPQTNEVCDDGNNDEGDYCDIDCQTITGFCGDNITQVNELCDDGNTDDGDYCSSDCKAITGFCGDDEIQTNEACDDGNTDEGDYCAADCLTVTGSCGDNITQSIEECDDGNTSNSDACLNTCQNASCGDGFVFQDQEECDTALDDTPLNGNCVSCTLYCLETDELIYINHNGDFSDGCEETIFAYETGAGETELQIAAFDLDGERNHYSAGFYNGVFDSRLATSDDGFLQKRNLKGEPVWAAFMSSENNVLPADDTYDDSFIKLHSSGNHLYALGHFCGNSSSNLGPCYAAVWEGNSEHHTVCSSSSDCEEGYDCKFNEGKCVQQITADTHSGKQNGVLLTFDQTGNLDWYVSFLSVSHAHPLEYNFLSLNYYDSDISLFNTETDSEGYVYVVGTFKSSMKIFTSSNGGVHSEWPRTFCETQSDCNFNDTCSDNCGVDCNGDGSAPENECLLEHKNESIGFLAKISPAGELIWVERFTNIRPLTIAVDTSSSGSLPEVAMGGIEILGTWNMPVLQVFAQESSGLNLSWQLANRVNGDKDQRFVEAAFDDQGGLWVAGRAGYQPPTPQPNYNMTFDSCSHVTQPTENALIFDGNDHVTLPNNQGLGYTPPLTVAGWVKVNNNSNGLQTIWGGGINYLDSYMLFIHEKKLKFQRCHSNGNCNINLTSSSDLLSDTWIHFAFTVDGETAKMYLNGSLDQEGGDANWVTSNLDSTLFLGRRSSDAQGNWLSGQLADVGIWNRALSNTEVQALHNQDSLEGELLTDLRAFYEMAVSGNTLTSTVNHPNAAATIFGANHRYEPHWCQTPTEACPEIESKSGADSCIVAFECATECYDETDITARNICIDNCREPTDTSAREQFDWVIDAVNNPFYGCEAGPTLSSCHTPEPGVPCCLTGGGFNSLLKCKAPNKDASFVAYYDASGQCIFNQTFYNVIPDTTDAEHVRARGLDVVDESALVSLYHPSTGKNDAATIALVSLEGGVEGGGNVVWSETLETPDQTPLGVTDLKWDTPFLYYTVHYETQNDMSFEVDFVTEETIAHTACLTESCSSSGLILKTRVDSP